MEILEMTYTIGNNGCVNISAKVLRQMGLGPGDHVRIAYLTDQSQENIFREFLLTEDSLAEAENCSHIAVPRELLRQAEIPEDADIQVICSPGAIILTQDPVLNVDALREVLSSMDIFRRIRTMRWMRCRMRSRKWKERCIRTHMNRRTDIQPIEVQGVKVPMSLR